MTASRITALQTVTNYFAIRVLLFPNCTKTPRKQRHWTQGCRCLQQPSCAMHPSTASLTTQFTTPVIHKVRWTQAPDCLRAEFQLGPGSSWWNKAPFVRHHLCTSQQRAAWSSCRVLSSWELDSTPTKSRGFTQSSCNWSLNVACYLHACRM